MDEEVSLTALKVKWTINLLGQQDQSRNEDIINEAKQNLGGGGSKALPLPPALCNCHVEASPGISM